MSFWRNLPCAGGAVALAMLVGCSSSDSGSNDDISFAPSSPALHEQATSAFAAPGAPLATLESSYPGIATWAIGYSAGGSSIVVVGADANAKPKVEFAVMTDGDTAARGVAYQTLAGESAPPADAAAAFEADVSRQQAALESAIGTEDVRIMGRTPAPVQLVKPVCGATWQGVKTGVGLLNYSYGNWSSAGSAQQTANIQYYMERNKGTSQAEIDTAIAGVQSLCPNLFGQPNPACTSGNGCPENNGPSGGSSGGSSLVK